MTQMNLFTKQQQAHRHREQTCSCQGGREVGEGWIGIWGLADTNSGEGNGTPLQYSCLGNPMDGGAW